MLLKDVLIDYSLLAQAIIYYKEMGFTQIEVPWIVREEHALATAPKGERGVGYVTDSGGYLVCSAEQGFIALLRNGSLEKEKLYFSVSPCFRNELSSEVSSKQFVKLELFAYTDDARGDLNILNRDLIASNIEEYAYRFFSSFTDVKIVSTDIGTDICHVDGLELGSYGFREIDGLFCIYGTGLALPRAQVVAKHGYHKAQISKAECGTVRKVIEEAFELIDAHSQDNRLMLLCELADMYGAIQKYLEKEHPSIKMEDLKALSDSTDRAFKTGRRS